MAVATILFGLLASYIAFRWLGSRSAPAHGPRPVSLLDFLRFVLSDLLPDGKGQAPVLKKLHASYGPAIAIGSLYSFSGSGNAQQDGELFKAIARLPKSAAVYQIFDPPVPNEAGDLVFHQTIFTQRDQSTWRVAHKQAAPMFRVQLVRERQSLIWERMARLTEMLDALEGKEVDLSPPMRAFAVDLTCLYLVGKSYRAQDSLAKDGQHHADRRKDIGPILTSLNREFGLAYWSPWLSAQWFGWKDSLAAMFPRLSLFPSLTARWAVEHDSLIGWTHFADEAVNAATTTSNSDNYAALLLGESSDSAAKQAATAQLLDGIFAGTDTLTASISLAAYILSSPSPLIRQAVAAIRAELPPQPWRLQDLDSLPWLNATVRELLRLTDANPHLLERIIPPSTSDLHPSLAFLSPGSRVGVAGYVVHRDAEAYGPNPAAFDCRRWLPLDHPSHHNGSKSIASEELSTYWMAFGRSPRACIAQVFAQATVMVFVATWVERYEAEQMGPPDLVDGHSRDCFNRVIEGEGRVPVRLRRRSR